MAEKVFVVTTNAKKLVDTLRKRKRKLPAEAKEEMAVWSSKIIARVISRNQGRPGLAQRTGRLVSSLRHRQTGNTLASVKTHLLALRRYAPYARVHEFGTRPEGSLPPITPKRAKMLAVPIKGGPAVDSRGVGKYKSPLKSTLPEQAGIHIFKARSGKLFLRDQLHRLWYRLMHEVRIKPRMGYRMTAERGLLELVSALRRRLAGVLTEGFGRRGGSDWYRG